MLSSFFLDPEWVDAEGLVGVGGDLSPERLLEAYSRGIFPWYNHESPILWWSPHPRAIIELDGLHISRRLARTIRSNKFHTTINQAFAEVMLGCSDRPGSGSWITPAMVEAYCQLHDLGYAHSLEVWHEGQLAGGIYGVAIGAFFAGESMFTRVNDASKVALAALVDHLRTRGFQLFDVQMRTPHTIRMGAIDIPRTQYLERLRRAIRQSVTFLSVEDRSGRESQGRPSP